MYTLFIRMHHFQLQGEVKVLESMEYSSEINRSKDDFKKSMTKKKGPSQKCHNKRHINDIWN